MNKKIDRVAVIGAGAAGLSAAYYLKKKGYEEVTVFEGADRIGGKCHTVLKNGLPFELGAFTITPGYKNILEIAQEVGAKVVRQPLRQSYDAFSAGIYPIDHAVSENYTRLRVVKAGLEYLRILTTRDRAVKYPGFNGLEEDTELLQPFSAWAQKRGLEPLTEAFYLPVTDMGYGDLDELPALYVLKYLGIGNFLTLSLYSAGLRREWPKRFLSGFEDFWNRVAKTLNIITKAYVEEIRIKNGSPWLKFQNEAKELNFDKIILACPHEAITKILPSDHPWREMFGKFISGGFSITLAETSGIPKGVYNAMRPQDQGCKVDMSEVLRPWSGSDISIFYSPGKRAPSREELANRARIVFGGHVKKIIDNKTWDYFPHLSSEAIASGTYTKIESDQGKHGLYVVGSSVAFETVETVAAYSRNLVEQFF